MNNTIRSLGEREYPSPLLEVNWGGRAPFVDDRLKMYYNVFTDKEHHDNKELTFELAGPREKLYFNPEKARSAIVTCGGLCPGLNDVIRSIVMVPPSTTTGTDG